MLPITMRVYEGYCTNQKDLTETGRTALADGNLVKLKELASSHPISTFLHLQDVKRFFQTHAGERESDLPLIEWLLDTCGDQIYSSRAFKAAAKNGERGLSTMQLLLERGLVNSFTVGGVFIDAARAPRNGEQIMEWLLQNARKKLCNRHLQVAFRSAASLGCLPRMTLVWEHTSDNKRNLYNAYVQEIFDMRLEKSHMVEVLEWLTDRLLLLQGTQFHVSPYFRGRLDPKIAPLVEKHLNEMGIKKTKKRIGDLRGNSVEMTKIDFRSLFEEMKPTGLPFFASVCRRMSDQMSSYAFKWAFVKAASHGPAGQDLMQWICEHSRKQLSFHTLLRASQIAEGHGHASTAAWIKEQTLLFSEEGSIDPSDVKLMLASSQNPSGYRPLGDAPERYGWLALSQKELDEMVPAQDLVPVEEFEDPFEGSDVTVIDDDRAEPPKLTEIRKSEANLFRQLYARIKLNRAPIKIEGSDEFQGKVLHVIRNFLSRPSGRWALLFACRLPFLLPIEEKKKTDEVIRYCLRKKSIFMNFSDACKASTKTREGRITQYEIPSDVILFHEMLHAIHDGQDPDLSLELDGMTPSDKNYDALEEQHTIAGVDEECDKYEAFALSENVYNFERGYPKRYGHHGY